MTLYLQPVLSLVCFDSLDDSADPAARALVILAGDEPRYRRLACALLLSAVDDARTTRKEEPWAAAQAREWIQGGYACALAEAVNLKAWPPTELQISEASREALGERIRDFEPVPVDDLRGTSMRGNTVARNRAARLALEAVQAPA